MLQSMLAAAGVSLPVLLSMMGLAFLTSVFHAVSGLAGALLLVILLTPIVGLKTAVPIVAVAVAMSNVSRLWVFRKDLLPQIFTAIVVTGLPGMIAGSLMFVYLPVQIIAVCFAAFLLLSIPGRRMFEKRGVKASLRSFYFVGPVYGLVSGVTMGAGLILAPFFLGAGMARGQIVAMTAAIGIVLNITKTIVFGASPLLNLPLFLVGIALGVCTMPGAWVGRWILQRTSVRVHTLLVEGIMVAGGLFFLFRALFGSDAN